MKVIGKTNNGFILEATNEEVKSLLPLTDNKRNELGKIGFGDDITFTTALTNLNLLKDIKMSESYSALTYLKNGRHELDGIIKKLEGVEAQLIVTQDKIRRNQV